MRPLKLSLSGFTCFREPTEVSFEDLELFAISGVTGAGKSTLLDAMTYALYGETARLGAKVGEGLFSPNLDKLSVQLTFRAGAETYRVARVSERKGVRVKNETRLERLNGDATWKQLSESEKLKDANGKIEEILGLSYDNFTRAVLLPQGAFDRFLHAKPGERTNLLRDLLGLGVTAEMAKRAGETARNAQRDAAGIESRLLSDLAGATPERRRNLKNELVALQSEQAELEAARGGLAERVRGLRAVQELLDARDGVQRQLMALQARAGDVAQQRERLARAKDADALAPHLTRLGEQRAKADALEKQQAQVRARLGAAERAFGAARRTLEGAEENAQTVSDLTGRIEGLGEARGLAARLKGYKGTFALAKEPRVPFTDAAWDAVTARLKELPGLERARGEVTDTEMRRTQAQKEVGQLEAKLAAAQDALTGTVAEGKAARNYKDGAIKAVDTEKDKFAAVVLRSHLHVGEACPVCEQTVAQLPPAITVQLTDLELERDRAVARYEELLERHRQQSSALDVLKARLGDERTRLTRAEADLEYRTGQLGEIAERLGARDPAPLRTRLQGEQRALLAGLAAGILERTGGHDPEAAYAELTRERSQLETSLQNAQKNFGGAQLEFERLKTEAGGLAERSAEATASYTESAELFAALLAQTGFADAEALRAATMDAPAQGAAASGIERFERDLERLTHQDSELLERLAGRTVEPGALAAALAEQARAETRLGEVQSLIGTANARLEGLEVQLETAARLRAEHRELETTFRLYHTLSRDLQVGQFPAYLLTRVQDDLAQRASDILKTVTEGRYDLFFREDEYVVLDAWTGAERSARTLSGGESFITSLALALALSDTLAGSTALGALFLDEGFGTLDSETLEGVAKILESLTAHGRMVGVITHVAALTERLPDRLVVRKGLEGSVVTWE